MSWFRKTARDYLIEGTMQSLNGEYEKAIETLSKSIELDPLQAEPWMNRGLAYLRTGQAEQAIQDFSESLRLEPNALCYYNRALAWLKKGELEHVVADLDESLRLMPLDAEAWTLRATARLLQGAYEQALDDIEQAITLGHSSGYRNKAIILEKAGRLEEAVASWNLALESSRNDALALAWRGLLLEKLGRKEDALADLNRAWKRRKKLGEKLRRRVEEGLNRLKES